MDWVPRSLHDNSARLAELANLDLENFTQIAQELARVVMASPYLKLEPFFGLEGFTARDPEGVRILTSDVGRRRQDGQEDGRSYRSARTPAANADLGAGSQQVVLQYDQERAAVAL